MSEETPQERSARDRRERIQQDIDRARRRLRGEEQPEDEGEQ